ncbi:YcxB family protein [Providencia vermicola]|uniref:YcxB family protein n=1 Tax=Providencia vermicola TaxID=333965 RepID=UPI0032DA7D9D
MINPILVSLNRTDYIRFSRYCFKNKYFSKKKTSSLPFTLFIFVFIVACASAFRYFQATLPIIFISFLLAVLLFITFTLRIVQSFNKAIPDDDGFLFIEREYRFDDEGMHETSNQGSSSIKWSAVQFIRTDGDLLYLFLDRVYAVIIPARSFTSEQESQQFILFVKSKISSPLN